MRLCTEVEAIADNDERKLICGFGFLEEILDFFWIVEVTLMADMLDFADLTSPGGSLDILEMCLGILAQVDHRAKVIV